MIVKEIHKGNTTILIDDTYMPKNEEEKQERYEIMNAIACDIFYSSTQ